MTENDAAYSIIEADSPIVIIDFSELSSPRSSLGVQLSAAFGLDGLGILCVRGVPGYVRARSRLLPLARTFAKLGDSVKVCGQFALILRMNSIIRVELEFILALNDLLAKLSLLIECDLLYFGTTH